MSSRPTVSPLEEAGTYNMRSSMETGFQGVRDQLSSSHPLENMQKSLRLSAAQRDCAMMRSIQGLHAPARIMAEKNAARQIGRLPFLPSSNLMLDVLNGNDITIGFEDVFCDQHQAEVVGRPHNVVEKELRIF